jgi:hypothetical protein
MKYIELRMYRSRAREFAQRINYNLSTLYEDLSAMGVDCYIEQMRVNNTSKELKVSMAEKFGKF